MYSITCTYFFSLFDIPGIPPISISALSEGSHTIAVVGRRTDGNGTVAVGQSQFVIGMKITQYGKFEWSKAIGILNKLAAYLGKIYQLHDSLSPLQMI